MCRYLTVMASGQEILLEDLPSELTQQKTVITNSATTSTWQQQLSVWADQELASGKIDILNNTTQIFEKIMLERALLFTHGHKQEAAKKLGWGRNTLTRKLKELGID